MAHPLHLVPRTALGLPRCPGTCKQAYPWILARAAKGEVEFCACWCCGRRDVLLIQVCRLLLPLPLSFSQSPRKLLEQASTSTAAATPSTKYAVRARWRRESGPQCRQQVNFYCFMNAAPVTHHLMYLCVGQLSILGGKSRNRA